MQNKNGVELSGKMYKTISLLEEISSQSMLSQTQIEEAVTLLASFHKSSTANIDNFLRQSAQDLLPIHGNEAYKITQFTKQLHIGMESYQPNSGRLISLLSSLKDISALKRAVKDPELQRILPEIEKMIATDEIAQARLAQRADSLWLKGKQYAMVKISSALLPVHAAASGAEIAAGQDLNTALLATIFASAIARISLELNLVGKRHSTSSIETVIIDQKIGNSWKESAEEQKFLEKHASAMLIVLVRSAEFAITIVAANEARRAGAPELAEFILKVIVLSNAIGMTSDIYNSRKTSAERKLRSETAQEQPEFYRQPTIAMAGD